MYFSSKFIKRFIFQHQQQPTIHTSGLPISIRNFRHYDAGSIGNQLLGDQVPGVLQHGRPQL